MVMQIPQRSIKLTIFLNLTPFALDLVEVLIIIHRHAVMHNIAYFEKLSVECLLCLGFTFILSQHHQLFLSCNLDFFLEIKGNAYFGVFFFLLLKTYFLAGILEILVCVIELESFLTPFLIKINQLLNIFFFVESSLL